MTLEKEALAGEAINIGDKWDYADLLVQVGIIKEKEKETLDYFLAFILDKSNVIPSTLTRCLTWWKDDFEEKFCQIEKTEERIREKANEWIQEAKIAEKELDEDIIIYKRKVTYPKR